MFRKIEKTLCRINTSMLFSTLIFAVLYFSTGFLLFVNIANVFSGIAIGTCITQFVIIHYSCSGLKKKRRKK